MPLGNRGERLGDDEIGTFLWELLRDGGNGMTEPQPHEKNLRLSRRSKWGASETGKFFLGRAGGRPTDLLTVDEQEIPTIVLLECKGVSVRKLGFCEGDARFHSEWSESAGTGLSGGGVKLPAELKKWTPELKLKEDRERAG